MRVYNLGIYNLGLPVLGLGTHSSGNLHWETTAWETTVPGYQFWIWKPMQQTGVRQSEALEPGRQWRTTSFSDLGTQQVDWEPAVWSPESGSRQSRATNFGSGDLLAGFRAYSLIV